MSTVHAKEDGTKECRYADTEKVLCSVELYDPIFLNDYLSID